ncbi:MAG TPA: hypothetical protein VMW48_06500 [Vicinamibacterales bacterium]|nr:hypothetical protein [Vicinamibacterales bacterium]
MPPDKTRLRALPPPQAHGAPGLDDAEVQAACGRLAAILVSLALAILLAAFSIASIRGIP